MKSGKAGVGHARRMPIIRGHTSCSTATGCPLSTIPLPAAVRCRLRRSGSGWRATLVT